ncbi:MAG TPA: hypothetical protein VHL34_01275 [Rhizomicrobium sp.]|jgi:hypothetical protein|nr:hypothetical protein [Rhizomicrobium sp.]
MPNRLLAAALAAGLIATSLPIITLSAAAQTAPAATTTTAKPKKPQSAAMQAMHERQKKCGAEWKEAKAAGKIEKGTTWPKFWSACNKRLKAGG